MRATAPSLDFTDTTQEVVSLVKNAAELLRNKGEDAFAELRKPGSRWRKGEAYIFVLDVEGNMLVHPDPALEGKNQMELKDISGKPIIRGLINAATSLPDKQEGWYHYQWPVPDGILPRWKSSYVRQVAAPSGKSYVVGCGIYNDRMERSFVVDLVTDAVGQIEKNGQAAFQLFRDPTGPFMVKDAYVFVFDMKGTDLVNPGFPNLEGRNLMDLKDSDGKQLVRAMFEVVQTRGSGWVDYMWPKPGESVSTRKAAYVSNAKMGDQWLLVGCGVYLADAPKARFARRKMTASELMALVREGAAVFEKEGEQAFPKFREQGSRWFRDDTYFFVWTMDGTRVFHAADPSGEGQDVRGMKDIIGRPIGEMILGAAGTPSGEGWIHYMFPEPGDIFPTWKSTFAKRVNFPSGKQHIVCCGIYNMQMDKSFIEDMVNRAADLIAQQGRNAFAQLRDKTGPFVFMDAYVFVDSPDGTELLNAAFPFLEGKNLMDLKDMTGKEVVREEIEAALREGSAWVDLYWYKPGQNAPARKQTFVRKVQSGSEMFVVGAGVYME
jgi:signal transduction histidine kinase